jgi:hypothetical protein
MYTLAKTGKSSQITPINAISVLTHIVQVLADTEWKMSIKSNYLEVFGLACC